MNKKTLQELISNCHAAGKKTAVSFIPEAAAFYVHTLSDK